MSGYVSKYGDIIDANRCKNNICHCLLIQVWLHTMQHHHHVTRYHVMGCMTIFHCDSINICSGYYVGIFCFVWTAILLDYCDGNGDDPIMSCQGIWISSSPWLWYGCK